MGRQVATLPGLGKDLSRDAYLKLVLRRALQEAMAAGVALGVVACGSSRSKTQNAKKLTPQQKSMFRQNQMLV